MKYSLPALSYDYASLEPHIDAKTMEIHHTKHHQAYIDKLNAVLEKYPEYQDQNLEDLLRKVDSLSMAEADKTILRNNGGGHINHSFFWTLMGPKKQQDAELVKRIEDRFGSLDSFKSSFSAEALNRFGSGWAWLVEDDTKTLQIYSTPNQDSPVMQGHTPLIGIDVWEHAYYLSYQNRRADYIEKWWNVVTVI